MRGWKGSAWDGGHRMPCFWHWPKGNLTSGCDVTELSAHIDVLPTLVNLLELFFRFPNEGNHGRLGESTLPFENYASTLSDNARENSSGSRSHAARKIRISSNSSSQCLFHFDLPRRI